MPRYSRTPQFHFSPSSLVSKDSSGYLDLGELQLYSVILLLLLLLLFSLFGE